MAIQINELIIRTTVTDDGSDDKATSGKAPQGSSSKEQKKSSSEALICECVEKVLEILREQKER